MCRLWNLFAGIFGAAFASAGRRKDRGATIAEYALVLALVTVALVTVLGELGTVLQAKISAIIARLSGVNP